jgi:hypothetical protein
MNGKQLSGNTVGFGLSVAITSILSLLLVLIKETHPPVVDWMKNLTSHHWITHGLIDVVLFVLIGIILSRLGVGKGLAAKPKALVCLIVSAVVISFVVLSGFYLFGD